MTTELVAAAAPYPAQLTAPGTADAPWRAAARRRRAAAGRDAPGDPRRPRRPARPHDRRDRRRRRPLPAHVGAAVDRRRSRAASSRARSTRAGSISRSGDVVQMPTTGGLDADGHYHPTWSPAGREPKVDPPGLKAEARRLTRVRRFRYFPLRIVDGRIEVRAAGLTQRRGTFTPGVRTGRPERPSCTLCSCHAQTCRYGTHRDQE